MKKCLKITSAFTLAEVLITLAIIGVVAALTIPAVIRNYQERQTVSALKKFYSQISQAFRLAEIENGAVSTWDWGTTSYDETISTDIYNMIVPYLRIIKYCGSNKAGCFAANYKQLNGENWGSAGTFGNRIKARLADGTSFWITNAVWGNMKGEIFADINGDKAPNTLGRDTFAFAVIQDGSVVPWGTRRGIGSSLSTCSIKYADWGAGYGCAAWVIAKENMDYLRKDISW